jgi:hypothetical protein
MKPKHFEREVRRARHLSARIKVAGRAHCECRVLDISTHGAKIVVAPAVPDHFELAFFRKRPKSGLRSGLAARQDDRRQVHLLSGSTRVDQSRAAGADNIIARWQRACSSQNDRFFRLGFGVNGREHHCPRRGRSSKR